MRDHYIETNGIDATHRAPLVIVKNDYNEIDWTNSTWTDTTIRILLGPRKKDRARKQREGLMESDEDLAVTFKSTATVAINDIIEITGVTYRLIDYYQRPYQGMTVKKGTLRAEPMGG